MKRNEAIEYLTRCADNVGVHWYGGRAYRADECRTCNGTDYAGHLGTPSSRYGWTSAHCAPTAYLHARILHGGYAYDVSAADLDYSMSLVVNDSDEPETDIREYAIGLAGADIDGMTQGYLEAQLWAQHDYASDIENETDYAMLDENYSVDDIAAEYVESVRDELAALVAEHPLAVRMYLAKTGKYEAGRSGYDRNELFGHDFYLTREGHGTGFWDRGLGELGRYLTDIAHYAGAASDLWDNGNGELNA